MTLPEPWVEDLVTIPELQVILRNGLLSKVRIFSAWCVNEQNRDRLVQVIKVKGRPLALARELRGTVVMYAGAPEKSGHKMRNLTSPRIGMWLDMDPGLYYLPSEPPPPGESRIVHPLRISGQCRHEHVSIPAAWLRLQVEKGVRFRVIDAATRREMGTRPCGT
jgi:hypothetical protein